MAMTIVMTLALGADDHDVLESQIRFHLAAGVDIVLVAGHTDGAEAVVGSLAATERVHLVPQGALESSAEVQEQLARLAARDHAADWIVPARGGEFLWPHGGTIADLLSRIATTYGAVQALTRAFPPVPGDGFFAERLVYRLSAQAWLGDEIALLRPTRRYAHRPVSRDTEGALRPLRGWYPLEVLWFPFRSGVVEAPAGLDDEEYAALCLDDGRIRAGLEAGAIQLDTRVRDALRGLDQGRALEFPRPSLVESAAYAVDAAALGEGEIVSAQSYLDVLEARLAEVEGNIAVRVEKKLRSLVRRRRPRTSTG